MYMVGPLLTIKINERAFLKFQKYLIGQALFYQEGYVFKSHILSLHEICFGGGMTSFMWALSITINNSMGILAIGAFNPIVIHSNYHYWWVKDIEREVYISRRRERTTGYNSLISDAQNQRKQKLHNQSIQRKNFRNSLLS